MQNSVIAIRKDLHERIKARAKAGGRKIQDVSNEVAEAGLNALGEPPAPAVATE